MIEQAIILTFSVFAIYLANDPRPNWRRFACIVGLLGQPAWFYASWKGQQYGVFIASFFFTFAWLRGFYNFWIKNGN